MDNGTFCANAFMTVEVDTMMYDHQNSIYISNYSERFPKHMNHNQTIDLYSAT